LEKYRFSSSKKFYNNYRLVYFSISVLRTILRNECERNASVRRARERGIGVMELAAESPGPRISVYFASVLSSRIVLTTISSSSASPPPPSSPSLSVGGLVGSGVAMAEDPVVRRIVAEALILCAFSPGSDGRAQGAHWPLTVGVPERLPLCGEARR
jgi:hypothetical protein